MTVATALVATLTLAQAAYADVPTISGGPSPQVGQTLTCALGSLTGLTYSWQRNGTDISGATSSTYAVTSEDVGQAITCSVEAAGIGIPAASLPVTPIGVPIPATSPPSISPSSISGDPVGQTLTCLTGSWAGNPTSYLVTWQRSGADIPGATGSAYRLTASDVNQLITCAVVAVNAVGNSVLAISLPLISGVPALLVPVETGPPAISGSPRAGQTLTCSTGSWLNSPASFAYTWQRTGATISGATGSSYPLTAADVAQAITCMVVASNVAGDSAPAISLPVLPVGLSGPLPTPGPTPGGSPVHSPSITAFWINPGKLTILVKGGRRSTAGTTFHFILDQSAGVLIEIQKRMPGRVKGKRCVAVTRRNRKARACPRWVPARVRGVKHAHAGKNQYKWLGRVGDGNKLLTAGTYRVYIAANNAAGWSSLRNKQLTAVRKQVKTRKHHV